MSNNIAGKVVVITGASGGLGEATAERLAKEGASVVLSARRLERIQSLAARSMEGAAKRRPSSPTSPAVITSRSWSTLPCIPTDELTS